MKVARRRKPLMWVYLYADCNDNEVTVAVYSNVHCRNHKWRF